MKKDHQNNQGDTCFNCGLKYYHGDGVEKDYVKAISCFHKSIEKGHVGGYFYLGIMHYRGYGCEENDQEAFQYFLKAIEKENNVKAKLTIGVMCSNGAGVEKNYIEAIKWFKSAIEQGGEPKAKDNLHIVYKNGIIEKNGHIIDIINGNIACLIEDTVEISSKNMVEAGELYKILGELKESKKWYSLALTLCDESDKNKIERNVIILTDKIKKDMEYQSIAPLSEVDGKELYEMACDDCKYLVDNLRKWVFRDDFSRFSDFHKNLRYMNYKHSKGNSYSMETHSHQCKKCNSLLVHCIDVQSMDCSPWSFFGNVANTPYK